MQNEHLIAKIGQYALIKNSEGKLLVLERAKSKDWSLPGGRIHKDEDWDDSLVRELKEEIGVVAESVKPFEVNILTDAYQTKYCVYFEVQIKEVSGLDVSREHSDLKWIDVFEADKLKFEDEKVKNVVLKYLRLGKTV